MKYHIYQKDFENHEVCETKEGRYRPVIIEASSEKEALDIYFNERADVFADVSQEDKDYLYYAIDDSKYKAMAAEKVKLKKMGYNSWDEYYEDLYPNRPIEV